MIDFIIIAIYAMVVIIFFLFSEYSYYKGYERGKHETKKSMNVICDCALCEYGEGEEFE